MPNEKLFDLFQPTPTKITTRCYSGAAVMQPNPANPHWWPPAATAVSCASALPDVPTLLRDWHFSAYSKTIPQAQTEKKIQKPTS